MRNPIDDAVGTHDDLSEFGPAKFGNFSADFRKLPQLVGVVNKKLAERKSPIRGVI